MLLRKQRLTPEEAATGLFLWNRLQEIGVEPRDLEDLVEVFRKIAPKGFPLDEFVGACVRLHNLEAKLGRPFDEVVDELEKTIERTKHELDVLYAQVETKSRRASLEEFGEMEKGRVSAKAQLEAEVRETERKLSLNRRAIDEMVSTKERLRSLSLEKLESYAKFIDDFEGLKFSAERVKQLHDWQVCLLIKGIRPNELDEFIRESGPLDTQISKKRAEVKAAARKHGLMMSEIGRLEKKERSLKRGISRLSSLGKALEEGKMVIPCKICGASGLRIYLPTRSYVERAMVSGLNLYLLCGRCGSNVQYSAADILVQVGWLALPE